MLFLFSFPILKTYLSCWIEGVYAIGGLVYSPQIIYLNICQRWEHRACATESTSCCMLLASASRFLLPKVIISFSFFFLLFFFFLSLRTCEVQVINSPQVLSKLPLKCSYNSFFRENSMAFQSRIPLIVLDLLDIFLGS